VRPITDAEIPEALELVWRVFLEFEAPGFSQEGVDEFRGFLDGIPEGTETRLTGCMDGDVLVGVIAVRPPCHLTLLFVDKAYHRRGVARLLWEATLADESFVGGHDAVTVSSSLYAVEVYKRFGFVPAGREKNHNGIISVPMIYELDRVSA
jgi:GNAT superfamily N-acetyltransferase